MADSINEKKKSDNNKNEQEEPEFNPKVEKIYKTTLRVMSLIIGIAIGAILIFPLFEIRILDIITQHLFRAGLLSLILVIFIEIFANKVKTLLSKTIKV
ncbi:MAG: hypothetical protein JXR46_07300 [Calditrichaceae bacterium]|nr:hypothetical protein [Calditrichaceae bacterium]MBN2708836.1 hypothetical protein [Calditrichaceae bacterium]RQV97637.1 MAG: hypothetical protein EH224_01055 [Calditrichota bacterium]